MIPPTLRPFLMAAMMILMFFSGGYLWRMSKRFETSESYLSKGTEPGADRQRIPVKGTILMVGDEPISAEDVEWEYELHVSGAKSNDEQSQIPELGGQYGKALEPLRQLLLSSLIERKILYSYIANDKSFDFSDPNNFEACLGEWQQSIQEGGEFDLDERGQQRLKERICEKSVIDQYLGQRVYSKMPAPTDAEIQDYYNNHRSKFRKPNRISLRQILVKEEDLGKNLRRQVNNENFSLLAKQHSLSPEGVVGGKLKPFSRGEMPAVFDLAFEMKVGEVRGPLKSSYGYHIFLLEDKMPKQDMPLEQARTEIIKAMEQERREKAYQGFLELALNTVDVKPPKPLW